MGEIHDRRFIFPLIECFNDQNYVVRHNAVKSIIKIGNIALFSLIKSLKSKDSFVRIHSTEALGEIGDKGAVKSLITCLKDPHYVVRTNSIIALGKIGDKKAISSLIKSIEDKEILVKKSAIDVIIHFDSDSIKYLQNALNNPNNPIKEDLIEILGEIGNNRSLEILTEMFKENESLRSSIAKVLGNKTDKKFSKLLINGMDDNDTDVRIKVAEALGKISDILTLEKLKEFYIEEADPEVRKSIKNAIKSIENSSTSDNKTNVLTSSKIKKPLKNIKCESCNKNLPITEFYKNKTIPGGYQRKCKNCLKETTAKNALMSMKNYIKLDVPFSRNDIKEKAGKPKSTIDSYFWALQDLGFIKSLKNSDKYLIEYTEDLKKFLENNDIIISIKTNEMINKLEFKNPIDNEIEALMSDNWFIRKTAANKLGKIGDFKAINPLIAALKDDNSFVKLAAAESLGQIGDEKAIKSLISSKGDNIHYNEVVTRSIDKIKIQNIPNKSDVILKKCEYCKKELPFEDFHKNEKSNDGLSEKCINCSKRDHAAYGLKEIIKHIKVDQPFSKDTIIKKSVKLPSTINDYLRYLLNIGLLKQNKATKKYTLPLNDKLKIFCKEYDIFLANQSLQTNDVDILDKNIEKQIKLLEENNWHIRMIATNKLGEFGDDTAIGPLIKVLNDQNILVQINASKALGKIGNQRAINHLKKLSYAKNSQLKKTAEASIKQIEAKTNSKISLDSSTNIQKHELKMCKICGDELSVSEFYNDKNNSDKLTNYCKKCVKERNAVNGLSEIIRIFKTNSTFPRKVFEKKSPKSKTTIRQYLNDMINFNLLSYYNKEKQIYSFIITDQVISFCDKHDIQLSGSYNKNVIINSNTIENTANSFKICSDCGKKLSISKFYKNKSKSDGLSDTCIDCIKKNNAAIGLKEIKKYINIDIPFSKARLKNSMDKSNSTITTYLRDLCDINVLKYNKKTDKYILNLNNTAKNFFIEYNIPLSDKVSSKSKTEIKICEKCEKELPNSEFYKNKNNLDGLTRKCKKCTKNDRAANGIREICKFIGIKNSFSKKSLSNLTNISKDTLNQYLNDSYFFRIIKI